MVNYFYLCSKEEENSSDIFRSLGCVEGDRSDLVAQVEGQRDFCKGRNKSAIDYEYFVNSIKKETVLYIKSDSGNVLGCCSISINYPEYITISGICVPDSGNKGIGTALIDKLKELASILRLSSIHLSVDVSGDKTVQTFYLKNGFKIFDDKNSDSDSDIDTNGYSMMRYNLPKGKGKKSRKRKGKNKSKKANKKRSRIYKGGVSSRYYAPLGDSDRDSIDEKMESALGELGISNTHEDKQYGSLSTGIGIGIGSLVIGGIGYLLFKKNII
jgi:N-acetylglutamate synthase-like GNAT family acetyltransferase